MDERSFRDPDLFKIIGNGKLVISHYKSRKATFISCTPAGYTVGLSEEDLTELIQILNSIENNDT